MITANEKPDLGGGRVNTQANSSDCKVDPSTQCGMVLSALRRRPMSAAELQWELPIADARAVVYNLIHGKGVCIQTVKHPHPNPELAARGRKIQRYHLVEPE